MRLTSDTDAYAHPSAEITTINDKQRYDGMKEGKGREGRTLSP